MPNYIFKFFATVILFGKPMAFLPFFYYATGHELLIRRVEEMSVSICECGTMNNMLEEVDVYIIDHGQKTIQGHKI